MESFCWLVLDACPIEERDRVCVCGGGVEHQSGVFFFFLLANSMRTCVQLIALSKELGETEVQKSIFVKCRLDEDAPFSFS